VIAAAEAFSGDDSIHFLIAGGGSRFEALRADLAGGEQRNLTLQGRVEQADLPAMLAAADLAVIPLRRGMAGVSVPSRVYNILAAGTPVIAMAEPSSEIAMLIAEERVGWVVPPEDAGALAEAIRDARSDADRLAEMGRRARAVVDARYTQQHTVDAFQALVAEVASRRRSRR
jgi:glycosyltransferase involved in cell wall biosynthesis